MGSFDGTQAKLKEIEEKLLAVGKKFREELPETKEELFDLLEETENVLLTVYQNPPKSTQEALLPMIKAMIHDKIFKNSDPNIQLQVAVLINELTRATAPLPPYPDGLMKECFKLFVDAFKYLHGQSEKAYLKALRILNTMAVLRTIVILLDIEDSEALLAEMFHLFFVIIRSNPYPFMIGCIEKIMNAVIQNSEEFSKDILKPLLASVKMDNKDIAPASWELGKKIFEKNPRKLQLWLKEADKEMQLDVDDYDDIVSSLLWQQNEDENAVLDDAPGTDQQDTFKDAELAYSLDQLGGRQGNYVLDGDNFLETWSCYEQMVQLKGKDSTSNVEIVNSTQNLQPKTNTGASRRKRAFKPHSLISPEEGYEHPLTAAGKIYKQLISDINNEKKKDINLQSKFGKPGKEKITSDHSPNELDSANEVSLIKKSISKRKDKIKDLEPMSKSRDIPDLKLKEELSNASKKRSNLNVGSTGTSLQKGSVKKRKGIQGDAQKGKDDFSRQEHSVRQKIRDEMVIDKYDSKDAAMKMVRSETSSAKNKQNKSQAPEKEKIPKKLSGQELVNMRIKVWWPMDKTFYTGTVHSYDPSTKKHKILYDDDEEEILNLKTEKWEPFHEEQLLLAKPSKKSEPDRRPSPPKELVKAQKTSFGKSSGSSLTKSKKFKSGNQAKARKSPSRLIDMTDEKNNESDGSQKEDTDDCTGKKAKKRMSDVM